MSELAVSTRNVGQAVVVEVEGTIDTSTYGTLDAVLEQTIRDAPRHVVIDMGKVGFVNSAGWGMMLEKAEKIVSRGGTLVLAQMQEDVDEIFQLLGLSKVIGYATTVEEAVEVFTSTEMPG